MNITSKIFIVFALMCLSAAAAYSQDCNSYLQQATELVSQKKYCDAKKYYQRYGNCNADADVSTEIAMCDRFCKIQVMEGDEDEAGGKTWDSNPVPTSVSTRTSSGSSTVQTVPSVSTTQGLSGFQLHGGLFLPLGEGNIATGYNLGFKVYKPVSSVSGLSVFGGADVIYNGMKSKDKDAAIKEIEAMVEEAGGEKYKYTLPSCLNVPVTAGVNYAYALNNKFSIYGELAVGLNLSKQMGVSISIPEVDYSYEIKYNMATGFTYGLEAGMLLNKKITVGIRYNDFGSYKYKGKEIEKYNGSSNEDDFENLGKVAFSGLSLSLGILF